MGLFNNEEALTWWLIVAPEVSRILKEFETSLPTYESVDDKPYLSHHEESHSFQKLFHEKANRFYYKVSEVGNPFGIEHESLLKLNTQEICEPMVVETLRNLESRGAEQFKKYTREVLETGEKKIKKIFIGLVHSIHLLQNDWFR